MRTYRLFPLLLILALTACSSSSPQGEVRRVYERFAAAVRSGDAGTVRELAPFLADDPNGPALGALKTTLGKHPAYRIRILDPSAAAVQLSDPRRTVIPFIKGEDGEWRVSDQVSRREFIDIIPAK